MRKKSNYGGRRAGSGRKTAQPVVPVSFDGGAGADDPMAEAAEFLASKILTPFLVKNLMRVVASGGQASAAASRILREMQIEFAPSEKRVITVTFMPRREDGGEGA